MTSDAKFHFDYTSTSLGDRLFFLKEGRKCGAATFSPLLVLILNPEAERSRGHFF